jgi:hypothetical protein
VAVILARVSLIFSAAMPSPEFIKPAPKATKQNKIIRFFILTFPPFSEEFGDKNSV